MDINSELINVITSNLLSIIMAILITGWMTITLIRHRNIRNLFFWEKVMGRRLEFSDEDLASASNDQIELEQIRIFLPAFKFSSIYHARAIISWCKNNRVGHDEIKGIDSHLTYKNDSVTLKKPKFTTYLISVITAAAFMALSMFIINVAIKTKLSNAILSTIKANGEWVWVYKDRIEELTYFNDPWIIYSDRFISVAENPIPTKIVNLLQEDIQSERTKIYVEKSIRSNFYTYLALLVLTSVYTMSFAKWVLALSKANALHHRLFSEKPSPKNPTNKPVLLDEIENRSKRSIRET
ncbi:DUF6216 family protein [Aeromonas media]|uniref:DUF6216 family protein n=1 Tax=Aeromonas media TaxID=651 RepID=UPI003709E611